MACAAGTLALLPARQISHTCSSTRPLNGLPEEAALPSFCRAHDLHGTFESDGHPLREKLVLGDGFRFSWVEDHSATDAFDEVRLPTVVSEIAVDRGAPLPGRVVSPCWRRIDGINRLGLRVSS